MSHHLLLIIHLVCAAVWVGGHLYLVLSILPGVVKRKNAGRLLQFEKSYEVIGIPSLLLLVITGVWMTLQFGIDFGDWFTFSSPIERVTSTKLILLITTVLFAISAQTRVLPKLRRNNELYPKIIEMGIHASCVTLLGIALLVCGSFVRYGGFF